MITRKNVNEQHDGVLTFNHTDKNGTKFALMLFGMGNAVHLHVYDPEGHMVFHNEEWPDTWKKAVWLYNSTMLIIKDEKHIIHEKFKKNYIDYSDVKLVVETWIMYNQREMKREDIIELGKRWNNSETALDYIYTAASYFANAPIEAKFRKEWNFSFNL